KSVTPNDRSEPMFSSARSKVIAAAVVAGVIAGGSYGIVAATSSSAAATAGSTPARGSASGGGSNARSGSAAGGSSGTGVSVASSGFTLTTAAGEKVTVKEASSTTYDKGTSPATASAVTRATEAALAAYPGGVVDRMVGIGNGDYEVPSIGVNWPHHIFVNSTFQVIGADDSPPPARLSPHRQPPARTAAKDANS